MARKNALLDVVKDAYVRGMARNVNALAEIAGKPFPDPRVYARGAEFVPGVGDAVGLGQDVRGYAESPNSLTPWAGLLSLAGLIPGVPRVGTMAKLKGTKVLDEAGMPRQVYHATTKDFDRLEPKGGAIFFSKTPQGAANGERGFLDPQEFPFLPAEMYQPAQGLRVLPSYLNLKNPASIEDIRRVAPDARTVREAIPALKKAGFDGVDVGDELIAFDAKQVITATGNPRFR